MSQPGDPTASPRKLKGMSTVIEYHQGCFFGEQAFLGLADSRSVSIRAKTYVVLRANQPLTQPSDRTVSPVPARPCSFMCTSTLP
jgi:hypothetical protein